MMNYLENPLTNVGRNPDANIVTHEQETIISPLNSVVHNSYFSGIHGLI